MEKQFRFVENGSVSTPAGFLAAGVTAGFKKTGAPDFAMLRSTVPATVAGAFTSNKFAAAPVQLSRQKLLDSADGLFYGVIINSGIANACTGQTGLQTAAASCDYAARVMGVDPAQVFCASTGRIGVQLDLDLIRRGVDLAAAALSADGGADAARAIMTTDTVPKSVAVQFECGGKTVSIGAMTKGAGMIEPQLKTLHATMLCFVTTDAGVEKDLLTDCLEPCTEDSFNRISVDGDMSTNDTVLLMANGCSGVTIRRGTPEAELFRTALEAVLRELARQMVMDGEGATKFVDIQVQHAPSREDARKCAKAVANSLLCKTAWFGNDPNWGRVIAALGYSGAEFDPDRTDIYYGGIPVVRDGGDAGTPESELAGAVNGRIVEILIDLNSGDADYWVWTSDVSYEYVKINADYHT
ncbi:MAG: bifunctional glutamate N-acetyltransferase/amino-acid acetyltransferase ArgJ [Lentisphaeria bacterium]|nr:bifunctional glutamate N-acetyltransferase/amino-acid acetyltransferase ArgJ [Lentisphaeria bacterium]